MGQENNISIMEITIKVCLEGGSCMDWELIFGLMELFIMELLRVAYLMEKECGNLNKMTVMKESTKIIKNMEKEHIYGVVV